MKTAQTALLITLACLGSTSIVESQTLQLQTHDGSTVVLETEDSHFNWVDVQGATSVERVINWSDVEVLKLVAAPVSLQVHRIEALLEQLGGPDYELREQAELALSNPDDFGPLELLIREAADSSDQERNYRIQRVLESLESYSKPVAGQFDELTLKDGSQLVGDAIDISLRGKLFGHAVRFDRNQMRHVSAPTPADVTGTAQPLAVRTFNLPGNDFYTDDQETFISFEQDRHGQAIEAGENANEMFVSEGLRLSTESPGFMMTLRYEFKFCPIDAGRKCICPYDQTPDDSGRPRNKKLQGNTIIRFCLPNQPQIPAGVHKFGLFIERVEHSRDFVVEAFNAHGQVLGLVEASDQICVFAGFQSNQPITSVRIRRNDLLDRLERNGDTTYAVDCLTFDQPVAVRGCHATGIDTASGATRIEFDSGNTLMVEDFAITDNNVSFRSSIIGETAETPLSDVRCINLRETHPPELNDSQSLMVQLTDGSIVKTSRSSFQQLVDFEGEKLDQEKVAGIWPADQPARFPEASDFKTGHGVIVYPSCRIIADDLNLTRSGYDWDGDRARKMVQTVQLASEDDPRFTGREEDPDLSPDVDRIDFAGTEQIPTLWIARPTTPNDRMGMVRLTDGQTFRLGGWNGFRLRSTDNESIQIEWRNRVKRYPLIRVASIRFPAAGDQ